MGVGFRQMPDKPMKKIPKGCDATGRIFKRISEDMSVNEDKLTDFIKTLIQFTRNTDMNPHRGDLGVGCYN